ncbi:hypothetical protein AVEN_166957-1 [Araneus ventricosus]|uniref:Uncharacterized protein n=1 Tax=Araneus ventricosus TaxID=182803 RepID=A0A4Y2V332_ARAVE|nr:hypothetical protein AVEN_166957-1 [Araneus ventricosus]
MRKRARVAVGSCGQQHDKSLRLDPSATPHRAGRRSLKFGVLERKEEIELGFETRFSRSEKIEKSESRCSRLLHLLRAFLDPVELKSTCG